MARRRRRNQGGIPFYPVLVLLLIGLGGYLGCDPGDLPDAPGEVVASASNQPQYSEFIPDRTQGKILIGSFNMQRLGPSKLGQPWVMERYAEIIRRFDVIALQEITSKDQSALPQLVRLVNASGAQYSYTISARIGRPSSGYYEQYAFIFDTTRINSGSEYTYVVRDENDIMHREPFVGRFETRGSGQPFRFTLINVHTDPDEIDTELDVLADVYQNVRQYEYPEDDVILMGDLNAAPGKLRGLDRVRGLAPLISAAFPTNTRKSKGLDNVLVDQQTTSEFTGRAGVMDLMAVFGISEAKALDISDHLPIWAEFSISERSMQTAAFGATGPVIR